MCRLLFLLVFICVLTMPADCQEPFEDNTLWTSFRIRKNINANSRFDVRPIVRFDNNISDYENFSIDLGYYHKLGKGWYGMLITRTWFIPDSDLGQFIWPEIGHTFGVNSFKFTNRLRLHYSVHNEVRPNDFFRWQTMINFSSNDSKFRPFIGIEPWFQLNGINGLRRIRYEPGFAVVLKNNFNFVLMYRREETIDIPAARNFNMIVATITRII